MIEKDIITESLELFQRSQCLTNRALAQSLGYHESTWVRLRNGDIGINHMQIDFLAKAISVYPWIAPIVHVYLLGKTLKSIKYSTKRTKEASNSSLVHAAGCSSGGINQQISHPTERPNEKRLSI
jgi:hypothetical protein